MSTWNRLTRRLTENPRLTSLVRYTLDEWLPPAIRDRWPLALLVARVMNPGLDLDFKCKAPFMNDREIADAYERLNSTRCRDATDDQLEFVVENVAGHSTLEVGAGRGDLSLRIAERGLAIVSTDLTAKSASFLKRRSEDGNLNIATARANVENLPFRNGSFDSVVCVHTLEHVRDLASAIFELRRVARLRLIVVVPRERFFRYSGNYHLQFFGGEEQLSLAFRLPSYSCATIDGALCYVGKVGKLPSPVSASPDHVERAPG